MSRFYLYSAPAQMQEDTRATTALTYTLQKRKERERGARERKKIQHRRRRGAMTTPLKERSPHLRPEGAQRGQPSEMRAPGAGPPCLLNTSGTSQTWLQVIRADMLSIAAELGVVATGDLEKKAHVRATNHHTLYWTCSEELEDIFSELNK